MRGRFQLAMQQWEALLASVTIEVAVVAAWCGLAQRPFVPFALVAAGATLISHPIAWTLVVRRDEPTYLASVIVAEVLVIAFEALAFAFCGRLRPRAAVMIALLTNCASAGLGLAYYALFS